MDAFNMTPYWRNKVVANVIAGFLAQFGMIPTEGSFEVKEYPPHIVWTQQARIPDDIVGCYDADDYFELLGEYLDNHNQMPTAFKLGEYKVEAYKCRCGCGTYLYVSVYI